MAVGSVLFFRILLFLSVFFIRALLSMILLLFFILIIGFSWTGWGGTLLFRVVIFLFFLSFRRLTFFKCFLNFIFRNLLQHRLYIIYFAQVLSFHQRASHSKQRIELFIRHTLNHALSIFHLVLIFWITHKLSCQFHHTFNFFSVHSFKQFVKRL